MKRILCFLIVIVFLLNFSACKTGKVESALKPTKGLATEETDPTSGAISIETTVTEVTVATDATDGTKQTKATKATKATKPTTKPTAKPTTKPTVLLTLAPTTVPKEVPTTKATEAPATEPTVLPTEAPTTKPTTKVTNATKAPTKVTTATKATTKATKAPTVETKPAATEHTHIYTDTVVDATCLLDGYTEHICACGERYVDTYTKKTNDHQFASVMIKKSNGGSYNTYQCKKCKLEVFDYGGCGAKGDAFSSPVKFYITYDGVTEYPGNQKDKYHLVIYGEGAMRSYEGPNSELPTWYYDVEDYVTRITVEDGVTEIGNYCFYAPDARHEIKLEMADSVKIIRKNAIYLKKTKDLILGNGVERVEGDIFRDNVTQIYLPRSLKYIENFARKNSADKEVVYYYQGTKAEFLNIKISYYGEKITMQKRLEIFYGNKGVRFAWVYLNCEKIRDYHDRFDI